MPDIAFDCPKCGGALVVSERGAGCSVPCPECGQTIVIPAKVALPVVLPPLSKYPEERIRFHCGYCNQPLSVPADQESAVIDCPKCHQSVIVPPVERNVADAPSLTTDVRQQERKDEMKITVLCPHCGWEGQANAGDLGGMAECPMCKKDFILEQKAAPTSGMTPPRMRTQADLNPRVAMGDIPKRVREVLWDDEVPLYAARPAHSALVLSMILSGIGWGIIGLSFFFVGIVLTLPLALVITYYSWKNRYYIITPERTIVAQGIFNVAIKILFNRHIQLVSINTGIVDRWIGLNTVEVSTAAQGGAGGIMASFPGLSRGAVQMKSVNVKDVIGCYDVLRKNT